VKKTINNKILNKKNIVIVIIVQLSVIALLWLASQLHVLWSIPIGIAFSFILLTNYALMHEAAHFNLCGNRKLNDILGIASGWLFPMSFNILQLTHHVHHRCNRTDHEMFDYYYPDDNLFMKYGQWYSILSGIYWPMLPFGSLLISIYPNILKVLPFSKFKTSEVLYGDFSRKEIRKIQKEVAIGVLCWLALWQLLDLRWESVLILYAFFAFNWSTRQYVTHAFTPRDVIEGALNLRVSKPMEWILLNGHWDQVHHIYPHVPWSELPQYASKTMSPVSYWRQYFAMWKGPRPNFELAPIPIKSNAS